MRKILLLLAICICATSCGSKTIKQCDSCHGTGICKTCGGDGVWIMGNDLTGKWEEHFCYPCATSGKCSECGGDGYIND